MKNWNEDQIANFVWSCLLSIIIVIVCALIILRCYVLKTYSETPISELPMWVYFLMKGNN